MASIEQLIEPGIYWDAKSYLFYLSIGVIFALLARCSVLSKAKSNGSFKINIFDIGMFLLIFCVIAFRSEYVGVDTQSYIRMFNGASLESFDIIQGLTFNASIEPLYVLYECVLKFISDDYRILFFADAAIVAGSLVIYVGSFFDDQSSCIPLILVSNYLLFSLALTRSAIASSFVLIALVFAKNNRCILSIVFSVIACYIHYTFVIILPFFIFIKILEVVYNKGKRSQIIFFCLLTLICTVCITTFFGQIVANTKYFYKETNSISITSYWYIFLLLFAIAIFHNHVYEKISKAIDTRYAIPLIFILYEIAILPGLMYTGVYRTERYFMIGRISVWANLVKAIQSKHVITLFKLMLIAGCIFYTYVYACNTSLEAGFEFRWMF